MLNKIMVKKDILLYLIDRHDCDCFDSEDEASNYQLVETKEVDRRRWVSSYNLIFTFNGKYYEAPCYDLPLSENDDPCPWEGENDLIECTQVEKKEVVAYEYVPVQIKQYILSESDLKDLIRRYIFSENIIDNSAIDHDDYEQCTNITPSELTGMLSKYKEYQAD